MIHLPNDALRFSFSLRSLPAPDVKGFVSAIESLPLPTFHDRNEWFLFGKRGDGVLVPENWSVKLYKAKKFPYSSVTCNDFPALQELVDGTRSSRLEEYSKLTPVYIDDAGIGFPLGGAMMGALLDGKLHTAMVPTGAFSNKYPKHHDRYVYTRRGMELLSRLPIEPETHRIVICVGDINCEIRNEMRRRGFRVDIGQIDGELQDGLETRFGQYIQKLGYDGYFDPKGMSRRRVTAAYARAVRWGHQNGHLKTKFRGLDKYKPEEVPAREAEAPESSPGDVSADDSQVMYDTMIGTPSTTAEITWLDKVPPEPKRQKRRRKSKEQKSVQAPGLVEGMVCPEDGCNGTLILKESRYGVFYGCTEWPKCSGSHGARDDGSPLGIPANKETKLARTEARDSFDKLWEGPDRQMNRDEAYLWLSKQMGISRDEARIGSLTKEQCKRAIQLCEVKLGISMPF